MRPLEVGPAVGSVGCPLSGAVLEIGAGNSVVVMRGEIT
jgi:hypothetical protein